jgi:hypothetical protein
MTSAATSPPAPSPAGQEAPDRLLGLGEAAALAQVVPNTLARWAERGLVDSVRPRGRGWRKFRESEMRSYAPGKMISVGGVSRLLGRGEKYVIRWAEREGVRCARLPGGAHRYLLEDVLARLRADAGGGS